MTLEKDEWRCDCWSPGSCPKCVLRCLNKYSIIFWGRLTLKPDSKQPHFYGIQSFIWELPVLFLFPHNMTLEPLAHISRSEKTLTLVICWGGRWLIFYVLLRIFIHMYQRVPIKIIRESCRARRHDLNYPSPSYLRTKAQENLPPLVHFMCQTWLGHKVAWH